jgi:hypothetical protein
MSSIPSSINEMPSAASPEALRTQLSPISSKPASSYRFKTSHFYGY